MNGFTVNILLNHSIIIAAILGIIRFRSISPVFYPFLYMIWAGVVNETISLVLIFTVGSNSINSNIYVLVEYLLILMQFFRWQNLYSVFLPFIAIAGVSVWIIDNAVVNNIAGNNSIFRIVYSLVIVLLSIAQLNNVIINERRNILRNPIFIICITFLFYYACKAFVEVFNAFELQLGRLFSRSMFRILYVVNLFSNLTYAISIICMPPKQEFTMPY